MSRYPDYAKTPREYAVAIAEALAVYPRHIRYRIGDIAEGITAICKFPPSVAEVIEMGNRMVDVERHATATSKRYAHVHQGPEPLKNYNPFPKLTEAFASEPHLLKPPSGPMLPFGVVQDASRALATAGKEAARAILNAHMPKVVVTKHNGPLTERALGGTKFATFLPFPEHLMGEADHDT